MRETTEALDLTSSILSLAMSMPRGNWRSLSDEDRCFGALVVPLSIVPRKTWKKRLKTLKEPAGSEIKNECVHAFVSWSMFIFLFVKSGSCNKWVVWFLIKQIDLNIICVTCFHIALPLMDHHEVCMLYHLTRIPREGPWPWHFVCTHMFFLLLI